MKIRGDEKSATIDSSNLRIDGKFSFVYYPFLDRLLSPWQHTRYKDLTFVSWKKMYFVFLAKNLITTWHGAQACLYVSVAGLCTFYPWYRSYNLDLTAQQDSPLRGSFHLVSNAHAERSPSAKLPWGD